MVSRTHSRRVITSSLQDFMLVLIMEPEPRMRTERKFQLLELLIPVQYTWIGIMNTGHLLQGL